MVSPVTYGSVYEFPRQIQESLEMQGVSSTMADINASHEQSKEAIQEIDSSVYNNG